MPKINRLHLKIMLTNDGKESLTVGVDLLIDFYPSYIDGKDILGLESRNAVTNLVKELAKCGYEF